MKRLVRAKMGTVRSIWTSGSMASSARRKVPLTQPAATPAPTPTARPWATRPSETSTFAKRLELSWSSPQLTSRPSPLKCSWIIASFSRGWRSHTSTAML